MAVETMRMKHKTRRNWKRWLLITATAVVVIRGCVPLASFWFEREGICFYFMWSSGTPISENLLPFEWGGEHSTIIDPDDDKPGYISTTIREWRVGPLVVSKVIYSRP
jgi:hypothetical protein